MAANTAQLGNAAPTLDDLHGGMQKQITALQNMQQSLQCQVERLERQLDRMDTIAKKSLTETALPHVEAGTMPTAATTAVTTASADHPQRPQKHAECMPAAVRSGATSAAAQDLIGKGVLQDHDGVDTVGMRTRKPKVVQRKRKSWNPLAVANRQSTVQPGLDTASNIAMLSTTPPPSRRTIQNHTGLTAFVADSAATSSSSSASRKKRHFSWKGPERAPVTRRFLTEIGGGQSWRHKDLTQLIADDVRYQPSNEETGHVGAAKAHAGSGVGSDGKAGKSMQGASKEADGERHTVGLCDFYTHNAIAPSSSALACWRLAVAAVSLFYVAYTPFYRVFIRPSGDAMELRWTRMALNVEPVLESVLVLDMATEFVTAVTWRGLLVRNKAYIARHYLSSWFLPDVIAALPLGYHFNKMIRLARLVRYMTESESSVVRHQFNPGVVALFILFSALVMIWHLIACTFWAIAKAEAAPCIAAIDPAESCWTPTLQEMLPGGTYHDGTPPTVVMRYWYSLFFAASVTTGVGWSLNPKTTTQVVFTCFMVLLGLALVALLVGSASNAVQTFLVQHNVGRERMQSINAYMHKHQVSVSLRKKLRSFLRYSWQEVIASENQSLLQSLPDVLRSELDFEINARYLQVVPAFNMLPLETLKALLEVMHRRVFLPNEVIIQEGDEGKEADKLFVLMKGSVAVEVGGEHLSVLTDGSYFGELAILHDARRSASVIAITFCECVFVTRADVNSIASRHPKLQANLAAARQRSLEVMETHSAVNSPASNIASYRTFKEDTPTTLARRELMMTEGTLLEDIVESDTDSLYEGSPSMKSAKARSRWVSTTGPSTQAIQDGWVRSGSSKRKLSRQRGDSDKRRLSRQRSDAPGLGAAATNSSGAFTSSRTLGAVSEA